MELVSIIISTFNNESTIKQCLESIKKQTYKNIEIIVVDEWSKDKTFEICKLYKTKILLHGKERANNRNFGIKNAKGNYYFIIDSDMTLEPSVIKDCVQKCSEKNIDVVVIPEKSVGVGYWAKVRALERSFYKGDNSVEAARFIRKKVIDKIGAYDPRIVGAEDWDLHQRILKNKFKVARIDSYIIHNEGQLSLDKLLKKKMYYGRAFLEFKKRYPQGFKKSVIRISLLKNWYHLIGRPKYGTGVFILKFMEGLALFYGMASYRFGYKQKHYLL